MAGRYGELRARRDFLSGIQSLDRETAVAAEESADGFVDQYFARWDRSEWTADHLPSVVKSAWKRWAAAEYLRSRKDAVKPGSEDARKMWRDMKAESIADAQEATNSRILAFPDGSRQTPLSLGGPNMVRIRR